MVHLCYSSSKEDMLKRKEIISEAGQEQWFYLKKDFPLLDDNLNAEATEFLLTKDEKKLAEEMDKLKKIYRSNFENGESPSIEGKPFYAIKSIIEESSLYNKVFRIMPKGGLLHVHSSAALSVEKFKKLLESWEKLHVSSAAEQNRDPESIFVFSEEICSASGEKKIPQYALYYWKMILELETRNPELKASVDSSIKPIAEYLEDDKKWEELRDMLSFCSDRTEESSYIWDELNLMFIRIDNLFYNRDFYRRYHQKFFKECLGDHIQYIEMRSGFQQFVDFKSVDDIDCNHSCLVVLHQEYSYDKHFYLKEMLSEIEKPDFLQCLMEAVEEVNKKQETEELIVKVILNVRRDLNPQKTEDNNKIIQRLDSAICYHNSEKYKDYNNFVIGFDFVSEEDRGYPTAEYLKYIYGATTAKGMEEKPRIQLIDFYLHAGESNWNSNHNVLDAIPVSKYRIGHGFNMAKHPEVINALIYTWVDNGYKKCFQTTFPFLEICPISNQLLRYFPDLRNHSAYQLMKNGIQCVIGNDDPFMFGNPGLSYDFWLAYVKMDLDFPAIKRLVYNSLVPYYDKKNEEFDNKWDEFVAQALQKLTQVSADGKASSMI